MERSLVAVLAGTFTLRFSTGLTGAMLAAYLAKLPEHGGQEVAASTLALLHASFYLAELCLSPLFGVISDRLGHHRVMLFGPASARSPWCMTGLTTQPADPRRHAAPRGRVDGRQRAVDPRLHRRGHGRQRAAPRQGRRAVRGRDAGRDRCRRLPWRRSCSRRLARPPSSSMRPSTACRILIYRYRRGRPRRRGTQRPFAATTKRVHFERYRVLLRTSHVWLLAPTWIAVNASIGLWFSQSIFQFSKADPRLPGPVPDAGVRAPIQISLAAVVIGVIFARRARVLGQPVRSMRRTTIIFYGILGGGVLVLGGHGREPRGGLSPVVPLGAGSSPRWSACSCWRAPRRRRSGLLADISERFPSDRGAIMGLYGVFLAVGQITGALIGGAGGGPVAASMGCWSRRWGSCSSPSCRSRNCVGTSTTWAVRRRRCSTARAHTSATRRSK